MNFPKFLRLTMIPSVKNIKINSTTSIKKLFLYPTDFDLISVFAKMYKFSYELVPPSDAGYGSQLPNGNWTGMVGVLLRDEADIAITALSISLERMKFIDFSFPVQRVPVTFVTSKPEYTPDITAFLSPFSRDLWISLVALLLIMPAIFLSFFKRRCTYSKLLLAAFRSLLTQPLDIRPQNVKEYFLIFFYIIGAVIFIHSYKCVLLSFITFPTFTGIRTIPELAESVAAGKHKCVSYPGAVFGPELSMSKNLNFQIIGSDIQQNEGSNDIFDVLKSSTEKSKRAFISTTLMLKPFKEKYFVSQDEFFPLLLAFSMRKDFCCKEQVTRFALYVSSNGLYQRLMDHLTFRESLQHVHHNDEGNADRSIRQFSLKDVGGAFFVLCTGYVFSIAVLTGEIIFQRFSRKN